MSERELYRALERAFNKYRGSGLSVEDSWDAARQDLDYERRLSDYQKRGPKHTRPDDCGR